MTTCDPDRIAHNWARGERGGDGDYLVIDNPVTRTKPIKIEREDEDIEPFSLEEIPQVIKAAREGWERFVVIVALGTGLRPNENFGRKRANVDLDAFEYVKRSHSLVRAV